MALWEKEWVYLSVSVAPAVGASLARGDSLQLHFRARLDNLGQSVIPFGGYK